VWFGLAQDQDNYVKLVVIQDGGPLVEMLVEEGGQAPVATNRVRTEVLPIDDGMDVELVLNVGTDGTVSGSYAIDGGPLTALPGTLSVPQGWLASNDLAAGIMATRRNQAQDLLFTFNAFAIQPGSDEPPTNGPTTFQVELSGEQEAPDPVETEASGSATVTLDGNTLTIEGSFEGLESDLISIAGSPAHVHEAPPGQNGPIVFNLDVSSDDNRSGTLSATQELSEAQLEVFNAGNYYINIHTEDNPGGELRGQLVP
jgi:hypothetical protein